MAGDFGYELRTGRGQDLHYWYRDPSTGLLYEGPKPTTSLVSAKRKQPEHPPAGEIEPCPWVDILCGNHEKIVIPGPPEVLYNKLGLTSADAVHPLEDRGVVRANRYMQEQVTATTPMTVEWLCRLHKLAFGDLYTWAGKYRTVRVSKGGKYPYDAWCRPQHIASTMETLEQQFLRRLTPVTAKQKDEVAERVATLISEFLAIHPFREGNGRVAQMMGDWVALQAGLPPINYGIDEDSEKKDAYILALHQGYDQDYAPLAQFVQGGIERSQRTMRLLKQEPPLPQ